MKKNLILAALAATLLAAAPAPSRAAESMEPAVVGPDIYHKVFENKKVRVFQVTFKPGAKIGLHTHPDHFVYALTDGELKITPKGKETGTAKFKAGDVIWINAESHSAENDTVSEVKLVVTELKGSKTSSGGAHKEHKEHKS